MASSCKIRFWSTPPPRTLKPLAPSPTVLTPGNSWMLRTTSTSPSNAGILLIVLMSNLFTLIWLLCTLLLGLVSVTTTSCNWFCSSENCMSAVLFAVSSTSIVWVV